MRARLTKCLAVLTLVFILLTMLSISASALDDTYRIEEYGISIKFPKSYYVVTRDTSADDEVFTELNLDYDDTMTAFSNANIYIRAYEPEKTFYISLTITKNEKSTLLNNYSDVTSAERKNILDEISADPSVSSVVEVKHNGNIFFDYESTTTSQGKTLYINSSNTVINGLNIDLALSKFEDPIEPDEAKALTNAANSLSFKEIKRNTGAVFDWWRLLLWIGILISLSIAVSVIYKHRDSSKKQQREERRNRRQQADNENEIEKPLETVDQPESFEESLGYRDEEEFKQRSEADEMAGYDISVKEKDPAKGVEYFEDDGDSIDDGTDYFDTYFSEPTEQRTAFQRIGSSVSAFFQYLATHIGYFFSNLYHKIFGKGKKK